MDKVCERPEPQKNTDDTTGASMWLLKLLARCLLRRYQASVYREGRRDRTGAYAIISRRSLSLGNGSNGANASPTFSDCPRPNIFSYLGW